MGEDEQISRKRRDYIANTANTSEGLICDFWIASYTRRYLATSDSAVTEWSDKKKA